jgi:hypothetical protein
VVVAALAKMVNSLAVASFFVFSLYFYQTNPSHSALGLIASILVGCLIVVVLTRFGFLAYVSGVALSQVYGNFPVTSRLSAWYAGFGLFALAFCLVALAWGMRTAGETIHGQLRQPGRRRHFSPAVRRWRSCAPGSRRLCHWPDSDHAVFDTTFVIGCRCRGRSPARGNIGHLHRLKCPLVPRASALAILRTRLKTTVSGWIIHAHSTGLALAAIVSVSTLILACTGACAGVSRAGCRGVRGRLDHSPAVRSELPMACRWYSSTWCWSRSAITRPTASGSN